MELTRRKLIGGIGFLFAAPAIIRVSNLMPIKAIEPLYVPRNTILTADLIAKEALRILQNELQYFEWLKTPQDSGALRIKYIS